MSTEGQADRAPTRRHMGLRDLESFNREVADLAKAGVPLEPGLRHLSRATGRTDRVMRDLADLLDAGVPLPEALARLGVSLPRWYQAVVGAGIRAGHLGEVLLKVNEHIALQVKIRRRMTEAFWYPGVVVCVAIGFVLMTIAWTHPRLEATRRTIRETMGEEPDQVASGAERLMALLSAVTGSGWFWIGVLGVMALVVLAWWLLRGSVRGDRVLWRLPLVGPLAQVRHQARFFELLGLLVAHEVPIGEALVLAGEGSGSPWVALQAQRARREVEAGMSLPLAMDGHTAFQGYPAWVCAQSQRQGRLSEGLCELAALCAREADDRAHRIIVATPPLAVIVAAVTVGVVYILGLWVPLLALLQDLLESQ